MIQATCLLRIIDNSGVKKVQCIKVYKRKYAKIGHTILVSVKRIRKKLQIKCKIKKGSIYKALVLRTKYKQTNFNNNYINFDENCSILLNEKGVPIGTRILGPVPIYFRKFKQLKIIALASKII